MSIDATATPRWVQPVERIGRVGRRPVAYVSFVVLATLTLLNLNGVADMAAGLSMTFSVVMLVCCIGILGSLGFAPRRDLGGVGQLFLVFLLVYVLMGTAVLRGEFDRYGFTKHLYMLCAAALTIVCSAVASRHLAVAWSPKTPIRWIAVLSLISVSVMFLGFFWPGLYNLLPRVVAERHSGFFANPNEAGTAAAMGTVFCFAGVYASRSKLLYALGIVFCGLATIVTFSRTAMVVYLALLAVMFASIALMNPKRSQATRRSIVVITVLIALGVFGWFLNRGIHQLRQLNSDQQKRLRNVGDVVQGKKLDRALDNRLGIYALGWTKWQQSPYWGHGLATGRGLKKPSGKGHIGTHNIWLLILCDTGVVPTLLLVVFLVAWLRQTWSCPDQAIRLVAVGYLVVFCLSSFTSHDTLTKRNENVVLGTVIGLMAAAPALQRRRKFAQLASRQATAR